MGLFDGKVAIVTGAGRGDRARARGDARVGGGGRRRERPRGRQHREPAPTSRPPSEVVDEITAAGGRAVVNGASVSSWSGAEEMIQQAVDEFGRLDIARQQRRHPARQDELQHGRGGVGCRHRRPPEGPLRAVEVRGELLAGAEQADRRAGQRQDREHRVGVGPLRQRGPGQLRGGQGRDRVDDDRHGPRARAHRRARQRDRAGRAHAAHRHGRDRRIHGQEGRRVRPVRAREHLGRRLLARVRPLRRRHRPGREGRWAAKCRSSPVGARSPQVNAETEWTIAAIDAAADGLFAKTGKAVPVFMPPLEA